VPYKHHITSLFWGVPALIVVVKIDSSIHYHSPIILDKPCEWKITPVGCFKKSNSSRALGTEIVNEMNPSSNNFRGEIFKVSEWDTEYPKLLCRCAREAKKRGFVNFGVYDTGNNTT